MLGMKRNILLGLFVALGFAMPLAAAPMVEITTSAGTIIVELDSEKAPKTVQNFSTYAADGFYNGTIFHRVIDGFMIQGGGFSPTMSEKQAAKPIPNEANNGVKNKRGTLAMARRPDPHSASSQFFINLNDNAFLDFSSEKDGRTWGYAVFGKVIQGMDVVDKIAKVPTANKSGHGDVPITAVIINSVKILPEKK